MLVPVGDAEALADSLIALLRDPELRQRIGDGGSRMVREHFAMGAVVDQHLEILAAMAGSPAHR
jgi:glycosyltransferase involved in cell wall biosynthesis